ncbi:coilin [Polyergus mexicanus]|uniref:coilin n=1 Tax=Polyergus mexicanus TaxID=615972 RepID=UPI0038B67442
MINAGITMKHPHFRLKIDLSKFFHDARKFCWIFIDGTKIQQIFHIQQHISKLFSITEPFHLLLNDTEYLPPTEDVRILKENETIQVVPGSGIKNEVDKAETYNGSMLDKQVHTTNIKTGINTSDALVVSNNTLNDTQPTSINSTTGNMTFYSVINDTAIDDTEEDTDSKVTDNNITEDCNLTDSVISIPKRKRVRKRKPKNQSKTQLTLSSNMSEKNKPKKPKIIDSYIIPSGKHIRFDNTEKEENDIAKQIVQEISRNESYISKNSSRDLGNLLALGQSSTPLTYVHKKVKNEVKMENELNDGIKIKTSNKIAENNISTEKNLNNKEKTQCYENWMHSDPEIIPIMTRKPQVKDIIAFKTLKIGADYTPQLSNFIVTEVVDFCAHSANYYLKIIKGKEEIQEPCGKFSLSEDMSASHCDTDTFLLKLSQIREPRLLASFSKPSIL